MRSSKRLMFIITISVLAFGTCSAQSGNRHSDEILTRISYRSTYGVDWREQQDSPQICFALYRIGYYRLSKMTENGTRAFQGTLSKDQLSRVNEMLKKLYPQKREDGIIREGSESPRAQSAIPGLMRTTGVHFQNPCLSWFAGYRY